MHKTTTVTRVCGSALALTALLMGSHIALARGPAAGETHAALERACVDGYRKAVLRHRLAAQPDKAPTYCGWIIGNRDGDKLREIWSEANFHLMLLTAERKGPAALRRAACTAGAELAFGQFERAFRVHKVSFSVAAHEICVGPLAEGQPVKRTHVDTSGKISRAFTQIRHQGRFVKHGAFVDYHRNGKMARKTSYRYGKRNGDDLVWAEDGRLLEQTRYKDGVKEGVYKSWRPNGTSREVGAFRGDKRHGTWKFFDKTGVLRETVVYAMGRITKQTKLIAQ